MKSRDVRRKFIEFYKARGHKEIPSAKLVSENDPTTLFTSSGMQPLIPYLLGEKHPSGKRLVDSQKSFRAQDIEEVGDNRHTTFFEMLGNWSLGDYFKENQLIWIFQFLTQEIGLEPKKLYVSVFDGDKKTKAWKNELLQPLTPDVESVDIWKRIFLEVGIDAKESERIFFYPAKKNWWSRSGEPDNMPPDEPGGPDSEVFFDFGETLGLHEKSPYKKKKCHPNCDCGRFMEIANSVFMQYQKQSDGSLKELVQKNVDFGGGLERMTAASINDPDVFKTDLFLPLISFIQHLSKKSYGKNETDTRAMRILADHVKGAVMMMADGIIPSNKMQGYILRRIIRRALLYGRNLGLDNNWNFAGKFVEAVAQIYNEAYPDVSEKINAITLLLQEEVLRFGKSLEKGLKEIGKIDTLTGASAFMMYETYGFPWEMTEEIARERGQQLDRKQFEAEFEKHKLLSRTAAKGMFKGGLADQSEQTTKLHTAHHLLLASLQKLVDPTIKQRGSNITAERLRIDFNFTRKILPEELKKIETLVNQKIVEDLPVTRVDMDREEAETVGAQMEFGHKYPDRVSVYFVGPQSDFFSAEFCGGPHVKHTAVLGKFTIVKEESAGSGIRRIYATLTTQ